MSTSLADPQPGDSELAQLRGHAVAKTPEVMQQFSNFTSHGVDHLNEVAHHAEKLIQAITLSPRERFCLMAACYTHDLGMAHGDAQHQFELETQDDLRRWHARLSGDYIRNSLPAEWFGDEGLRDVVATISEGHGRWDWDHPDFEDRYDIRVRLLTTILSLADALDLRNERRIPKSFKEPKDLLTFQPLQNDVSRVHWLKHYYSLKPSVSIVDNGRTAEISLFAKIGMAKKDPKNPVPDEREPLIKELIQSEVVDLVENRLFQRYLFPHLTVRLVDAKGTWPSYVQTRTDPLAWLFPEQLVETVLTGRMVRAREIPLNADTYYSARIEAFVGPRDLQVSISWLPSFASTKDQRTPAAVRAAHERIGRLAESTWDYVLWPTTPYIDRALDDIANGNDSDVRNRLNNALQKMESIRAGTYRKYYIAIDIAAEPLTTTRYVAKYGRYRGFPSGPNFLGGSIHLRTDAQEASFLVTCRTVAEKLGLQNVPPQELPARLQRVANSETAYEVSICSLATVVEQLLTRAAQRRINQPLMTALEQISAKVEADCQPLKARVAALTNNDLRIVDMDRESVSLISALEHESSEYPWSDSDAFLKHIDSGGAFMTVLGQTPVGYVLTSVQAEGGLLLVKMVVKPAYRRRGYAGRILQHVAAIARAGDHKFVDLHVRESNEGAIELYQHHGFDVIRRIEEYYQKTGETPISRNALMMRMMV